MSYNHYRHRSYNISKTKARNYAQDMESLELQFRAMPDWSLSSMQDSCYKLFDDFEIRLSNHSARYKHDLEKGLLLVNVKKSKLEFIDFINNDLEKLLKELDQLNLNDYRFINVIDNRMNCYFKGFKTKKDIFEWK